MFSFLKNPLIKILFLTLFFTAIAQTALIILLLCSGIPTFWILLIPVSLLAIIPLLYNKIRAPIDLLTHSLENQSLTDLKTVVSSGGDLGNLANATYKLLKKQIATHSELLTLKQAPKEKEKIENQHQFIYNIESVGRLAGGIAHDFNNILGAVSGYAEIILTQYPLDDKLQKYGKMIISATNRASGLTKKLIQFARKDKLTMSCIEVSEQLTLIIDSLKSSLCNGITVTCSFDTEDSYIYGDLNQFQITITNIAINAQEAMPQGGELIFKTENITIDKTISKSHLFTITPGYYLAISICDSGKGMNKEELSHIFEPFYTTKDKTKSSGLALASIYGIIKSHNGFIDVESSPGAGSTFTLYFPVVKQQCPVPRLINQKSVNKTIFLIDDEQIIREAVGEMLTWLGFNVTTAASGSEAIELFEYSPFAFDLIILDMVMPGISGKECFKRMKELNNQVNVLISTGYSADIDQQQLLDDGVVGILQKPFESSQLTQAIFDALS